MYETNGLSFLKSYFLLKTLTVTFPSIEECGCQCQHVPVDAEAVSSTGVLSAPIVPPLRSPSIILLKSRVHFVTGIVILAKDKTVFELLPKQLLVLPFESNNNTH